MATIAISCPKCENQIKVPPELEGKKIRCKECSHAFVVKLPAGAKSAGKPDKTGKPDKNADKGTKEAAAKAKAADEADDDANPYKVTDHDFLPRCAYCAKEMDSEDQVVCLNCGYNHRTRERIQTAKTLEPTGGEWFMHLLPGILCALVVLLALAELSFSWIGRAEKEAQFSEAMINPFALGIVIWRSVLWLFIGFFTGKFAVKRLILHPRPPEKVAKMKTKK